MRPFALELVFQISHKPPFLHLFESERYLKALKLPKTGPVDFSLAFSICIWKGSMDLQGVLKGG